MKNTAEVFKGGRYTVSWKVSGKGFPFH